jgi:hypothetical protein
MRFSAGLENPGLKPIPEGANAFRWTKVQLPLLKQGAPTKPGVEHFSLLSEKSALLDFNPEGLTDRYISVWLKL